MVPGQVIDALLRSMGVEPGDGVSPDLLKGGFDAVRREVKRVGREGWSAGQVLEQVGTDPGPCRRSRVASFHVRNRVVQERRGMGLTAMC